jgi:hypothetical protein
MATASSPRPRVGRLTAAFAACATAAVLLVGAAGADSTISFSDPPGDGGSSTDITALEISSSPGSPGVSGGLGFWATVKPDSSWCRSEGGDVPLLVAVDTDQNPDTGSAFYGTEVEFAFEPSGQARAGEGIFLRASGWEFRRVPFPDGFGWGCGPEGGGYSVGAAALGLSPTAGFNVVVATQGPHIDTAPDIGTFNYQPVPGTQPPALGPDTRAPHVEVYAASAVHGKVARLTYWTLDGRGRTADTIRIYRGARLLKTIRRPLRDSNPFLLSHEVWRVPRAIHGRLRYSIRSTDAAGNASRVRWAWLLVR